jgi:hypothetical protein
MPAWRHRLRPDSVVHSQDHRLAAVPYKLVRGGGRVFRCRSGLLSEGEVWFPIATQHRPRPHAALSSAWLRCSLEVHVCALMGSEGTVSMGHKYSSKTHASSRTTPRWAVGKAPNPASEILRL